MRPSESKESTEKADNPGHAAIALLEEIREVYRDDDSDLYNWFGHNGGRVNAAIAQQQQ